MNGPSLATQIRDSFSAAASAEAARDAYLAAVVEEPLLATIEVRDLPRLVHGQLASVDANELLGAVVRSYQRGSRELWAAVLLEMLAPTIIELAARLYLPQASMSHDDLNQQVLAEVLAVAATVRVDDSRWLKLRITRHVSKRLVRHLIAEARELHAGSDALDALTVDPDEFAPELDEDLAALYRMKVRGELATEIARERGLRVDQLRHRLRLARRRVITQRAA